MVFFFYSHYEPAHGHKVAVNNGPLMLPAVVLRCCCCWFVVCVLVLGLGILVSLSVIIHNFLHRFTVEPLPREDAVDPRASYLKLHFIILDRCRTPWPPSAQFVFELVLGSFPARMPRTLLIKARVWEIALHLFGQLGRHGILLPCRKCHLGAKSRTYLSTLTIKLNRGRW